jgi:dihydrofolate synthase/folylpolyglutamate synthase
VSLRRRRPGRIRPQLERLNSALDELGNPQSAFPSALVVGTNGKGSTAAMMAAVLTAHRRRVGLYTSPHLVRVEERIRVDGAPVAAGELDRQLARLERFDDLTFFETLTAAALLVFADAGVDCAVLEAGMGGRWDATRVAGSELAGLTNVGSDHEQWLGSRWQDRAADKGAALAGARFAVIGPEVGEGVVQHLGAPAARRSSELVQCSRLGPNLIEVRWSNGHVELTLPVSGAHQFRNLELALALARCAERAGWIDRLRPASIRHGLDRVHWPGRLTTHRVGGRRVLLDCAHNAEAAIALAQHLAAQPALYHLLFSCLDDKPVEEMAAALRPHVGNVAVCPIDDERSMPVDRLRAAFPEADCAPSAMAALEMLPAPVVVAGSVRLAGELLAVAERSAAP